MMTAREMAHHVAGGLFARVSDPRDRDVDHILDGEGCIACEAMEKAETRYFFWLLAENQSDLEVMRDFAERWGFCRRHARYLAERAEGPGLAHLYQFTCAHALSGLEAAPKHGHRLGRVPGNTCPACLVLREVEQGVFGVLRRALGRADLRARYPIRAPLCFLHAQHFLACAPRETVRTVIEVADRWLANCSRTQGAPTSALDMERAATALAGRMALTAGTAPPRRLPIGGDADPARCLSDVVTARRGCPVCYEMLRVEAERLAWLAQSRPDVAVREIEDLLPLCNTHLWAAMGVLPARLRAVTLAHAMGAARAQLALALRPEAAQVRRGPLRWLRAVRPAARLEALAIAREIAAGPLYCPMCVRAEVAERRSLGLVLTLAETTAFRRQYEAGTGLCMRHLAAAQRQTGAAEAVQFLLSTQHAKLRLLDWELQEALRKQIWTSRCEHRGSEGEAWMRALMVFAGVVSLDLSASAERLAPNTIDLEGTAT
ncbi:DUF6062 family protein [Cupriavidus sp. TMH.W2]|uniref:DUF6062 family protein n=1 Tax=Cupriavidus sp. TMH.W2 TaxID=3434465 RepID=UPI003D78849B